MFGIVWGSTPIYQLFCEVHKDTRLFTHSHIKTTIVCYRRRDQFAGALICLSSLATRQPFLKNLIEDQFSVVPADCSKVIHPLYWQTGSRIHPQYSYVGLLYRNMIEYGPKCPRSRCLRDLPPGPIPAYSVDDDQGRFQLVFTVDLT